jgi:hypothetical protein
MIPKGLSCENEQGLMRKLLKKRKRVAQLCMRVRQDAAVEMLRCAQHDNGSVVGVVVVEKGAGLGRFGRASGKVAWGNELRRTKGVGCGDTPTPGVLQKEAAMH